MTTKREKIDAFVAMRRFISSNAQLFQRIESIEYHQQEMKRHQEQADKRIDEVYHIGVPIKDLGKKWFAFTRMRDIDANELINKIKK